MSVVDNATKVVTVPVVAIKTRPIVWGLFFVLLAMIILRYAIPIRRQLVALPVVGPHFDNFMGAR